MADEQDFETPAMSRTGDTSELRAECPRWILNTIDAVVIARGGQSSNVHRGTVVNEVLAAWAEKKLHEASLLQRIAGCHPSGSDSARVVRELRVAGEAKAG